MSVYETEEEQVESLKKWWKENGRSVIAGVVIGLGGVFGWQAWQGYSAGVAQQAANRFDQLLMTVQSGDMNSALKQSQLIRSDFQATPYAVFAALVEAKIKIDQKEPAAARSSLEWAVAQAPDPGLETLARLRLARLLLAEKELDAAETTLAQITSKNFAADIAELKGDLALARGDQATARQAYRLALGNSSGNTALLQMKLDDLAVTALEAGGNEQ